MMSSSERAEAPHIAWYFDVISPYSYLALPAVEALARRRRVVFEPVLLGALLSHWGIVAPAEIAPKRLHTYRFCQFLAERAGIPMRFPPRHPFLSLGAQRLITALAAEPRIVRAVFDFIWAEGRDASDPDEFAVLCRGLGVRDFAALVEQRGAKAALRAATEAAAAAGVFGVPTLRIGSELFWGADALPMAEAYLENEELFTRGEMARVSDLPIGVTRRS